MKAGQLHDCPTCAAAAMEQGRWLLLSVMLLTAIPLSENFEVTSAQNVVGIVGQGTLLPCHISSTKPLDNFEVQWQKITEGHVEEIHLYRHFDGKQTQKHFGWTSMPTDAFTTGNVSVTLKNVQPADEGMYRCFVKSIDWSADSYTMLNIAGTSEIFLDILGPQGQGLELACRSHGWFPKPTVQWNAENKQSLSPETAIHEDTKQVFRVLSRVTVTEEVGDVTCEILNPLLQTEKKITVHLSSAVFPRVSPWLPAFWILLSLLLLTLAACVFLLLRAKQRASKRKSQEEQALQEHDEQSREIDSLRREIAFRRARSHMVTITLDCIWKHSELAVSSDRRTVKHMPFDQGPIIGRQLPIVLGREGFAFGHQYWEVWVGDGLDWELGVLTETVRGSLKQGTWEELPEDGVWSLRRVNGKYCPEEVNDKIQSHTVPLAVVGLDLDLEQSTLSFYNIGSSDRILEISIEGSTKLYPFLRPGLAGAGGKGKPLMINSNTDWDFPQTIQKKRT